MGKVNLLPPEIISRIAAGEVIERPASVIKELIENSFDAGTKSLDIHLKQAGKTYISIKDSGEGIQPEDIEKIFERHSTSKISSITDLDSICSLGFRGEALYSIAAVSDITLKSKTKDSESGWEIHLRGGEKLSSKPSGLFNGTEVEVKELFFNTPARKKFLKSDNAEIRQIINMVTPYTLIYPDCRILLTHHNKKVLDLPAEKGLIKRIEKVLNLNPENIIFAEGKLEQKGIKVKILLGDINIQRPRKDMQFVFVNSRPVQHHLVNFHLNKVYKLLLPPETYPFFAVYINLPPENVDVNAHPTKREVRIKNDHDIIALIRSLSEDKLINKSKPKQMGSIYENRKKYPLSLEENTVLKEPGQIKGAYHTGNLSTPAQEEHRILKSEETAPYGKNSYQEDLKSKLLSAQYAGAFLNKYLFFESGESLLVIDQHAAHERINYEALLKQIKTGRVESQNLLSPEILKITPQEKIVWEEMKDKLEKIGFSTTLWDNESISIQSYPIVINRPETAVRNILAEKENILIDTDTLARRACRKSIMAGDRITPKQALNLIAQLTKCADPFICPHGRPTVTEIKESVFEKQFLRK